MDQAPNPEPAPKRDIFDRAADREATCPAHGAYTSHNLLGTRWTTCPTCAAERDAEDERYRREQRDRRELERTERRIAQSGLHPRFVDATFDSFRAATQPQIAAKTACRGFVESLVAEDAGTGGLWLVGPPGTGKTHLGSAMVIEVVRRQKRWAAIHSARAIVRMLRSTWGKHDRRAREDDPAQTEQELLEDLGTIALLVIDEIGVGFGSEAEMVQLFDVIDLRYRNQLPTVVISNLTAKDLKPVLGDAAFDRLREGATIVPCNWKSYRAGDSR